MRTLALLVLVVCALAAPAQAAKPWLFFDLGENSLLATGKGADGDLNSISWMRFAGEDGRETDAHAYLAGLRQRGYAIGLIVNIPEEWGDPDLSRARGWLAAPDGQRKDDLALALTATKMETLVDYFEGHGPGDPATQARRWTDPKYPAMDFAPFTRGAVLFPFFTRFRKPMDGPLVSEDQLFLYRAAKAIAAREGRAALYQSADPGDVAGAQRAGLPVRALPFRPGRAAQARGYYADEAEIERLAVDHGP